MKVNVKVHPITCNEGPEKYSSTLSLSSSLHVVDGQRDAPAALPPGKDPIPTVQEVGSARGPA